MRLLRLAAVVSLVAGGAVAALPAKAAPARPAVFAAPSTTEPWYVYSDQSGVRWVTSTSDHVGGTLVSGRDAHDPAVTRDGSKVAFVSDADGQLETVATSNDQIVGVTTVAGKSTTWPHFKNDSTLVYQSTASNSLGDIYSVATSAGSAPTKIVTDGQYPSYTSDGHLIFKDTSPVNSCLIYDGSTSDPMEGSCLVTPAQARDTFGEPASTKVDVAGVHASQNGTGVAFLLSLQDSGSTTADVYVAEVDTASDAITVLGGAFDAYHPATPFDGSEIPGWPVLDASGTEISWLEDTYDTQPEVTSSRIRSVDTETGLHPATVLSEDGTTGIDTWFPLFVNRGYVYHPLAKPVRVLDTRTGLGATKGQLTASRSVDVAVRGGSTGIPSDASAVVANLGGVAPTRSCYLQLFPTPTNGIAPTTSTLDLAANQTASSAATVTVPASGTVRVTVNDGAVDATLDLTGYYESTSTSGGSLFDAETTPVRSFDTRASSGGSAPLGAGGRRDWAVGNAVPSDATAVVIDVGAIAHTANTYVSAYPSFSPDTSPPTTSTVVLAKGEARENLATVSLNTARTIRFYNLGGSTDVFVDLVGYYSSSTGAEYVPLQTPYRIFDSRNGTKTRYGHATGIYGGVAEQGIGVGRVTTASGTTVLPTTPVALQVTLTGIAGAADTYLSLGSNVTVKPSFSTVDVQKGKVVANAAVTRVASNGEYGVFNEAGTANAAIDVTGFFVSFA